MKLKPLIILLILLFSLSVQPARMQETYRIYVLPVEFPDNEAYLFVDEVLEPVYEFADSYIPEVSYYRATVEVDYYPDWIMLDKSYEYYNDGERAEELVRDALMALPPEEDLSGYDVILVVHAGDDEYISGFEEDMKSASSFGGQLLHYSGGTLVAGWALVAELDWTAQIAHHVLHALGVPEAFSGDEDYADGWDPMGLSYVDVDYPVHVNAATKLQMGWLLDNETYTLTSGEAEVELVGLSLDEPGYKAILLPISGSESYVIEARVFSGYDEDLPDEGVLIWHKTRDGVRLVDANPDTEELDDACLIEGDVFEDVAKGVRVEVLSYEGGTSFTVRVEFSPGVVVDEALAPAGRLNLGEEAKVLFHAYRAFDGRPAEGYIAVVQGRQAEFNSTGWAEFTFTSDEPLGLEVGVDEIRYEGESIPFTFNATAPLLVWDGLVVESVETDRPVGNVGYSPEVRVYVYYESDHAPLSDGLVVVNGTQLEFNGEYWSARMPASQHVGRATYCIDAVEDHEYNLTSVRFVDNCTEFAWDRVLVTLGSWYGDLASNATVGVEARYELSGQPFEGDVYINGTMAEYLGPGEYRLVLPPLGVGNYSLEVQAVEDYDYNVTAFSSSKGSVAWDAVRVVSFGPEREYVDVGRPVRLEAKLEYALSGQPFEGDVYINGTMAEYLGPGEYYVEVSRDSAGPARFTITEVRNDITTLLSRPEVEVTWDRVLITLSAEKEEYKVGEPIEIQYAAVYESDGSPFKGEVELNLPAVQEEPGTYEYTVKAIHDEERGITAFESNTVTVNVVQAEGQQQPPSGEQPQEQPSGEQPQGLPTMAIVGIVAVAVAAVVAVILVKRR